MAWNFKFLLNSFRALTLILTPIALLIIIILPHLMSLNPEDRMNLGFVLGWVYVFFLVGIYWMFNILHVAATSFLILVLLPLLGIVNAKTLAFAFMSDHNIVVFGSVVLMMAIDNCGLRRRLTLAILKHSSGSAFWIFVDIYLVTIWTAMWINSAAATFLMMKVIDDVMESLQSEVSSGALGEERAALLNRIIRKNSQNDGAKEEPKVASDEGANKDIVEITSILVATSAALDSKESYMARLEEQKSSVHTLEEFYAENEQVVNDFGGELLYVVAAAANIGGLLWPFGNPMGFEAMKMKHTPYLGVTLASWIIYSLPLVLINGSIAFVFFYFMHFAKNSFLKASLVRRPGRQHITDSNYSDETLKRVGAIFSEKVAALPTWAPREMTIVFLAITGIVLCLTRLPIFTTGWADALSTSIGMGDSVSYIIIALLIFILPAWSLSVFKGPPAPGVKPNATTANLGWKKLQSTYPYAILVLIGGAGCIGRHSGNPIAGPMSKFLAEKIFDPNDDQGFDITLLKFAIMMITLFASGFMPNPGTSVAITQLWLKMMETGHWHNKSAKQPDLLHGASILPILSVASLCFVIPASSVPTAMVYCYKGKKTLSAWYFLRVGMPLLFCTLIATLGYALSWTPDHGLTVL